MLENIYISLTVIPIADVAPYLSVTNEGVLQGRPVLLDTSGKRFFFEWRSVIACRESAVDSVPMMPCYVSSTNSSQQPVDLTGLTKVDDAYRIPNGDGEIKINVCRQISTTGGMVII